MSMKDEYFDDKSEGKRSVEMLSLFIKENIYFALSWTLLSNKWRGIFFIALLVLVRRTISLGQFKQHFKR